MKRNKLVWHDERVFRNTQDQIERNMGEVVQFMRGEVIKSINSSQTTRTTASGNRVGLDPSKAGQPPKRVHGDLVRSIVAEVDVTSTAVTGRYGSTQNDKALALELGTSKMAARPFLRPPLLRERNTIQRMLIKR